MKNEASQNILLHPGELQWLINRFHLVVYPKSPLASLAAPAHGKVRSFESRGLLAPVWRSALTTLSRPEIRLRVVTPGPLTTRMAFYYASRSDPSAGFVGHWREGEGFRLSVPVSANDIAASATAVLALDNSMAADSFSALLSPSGTIVLMAYADAIRSAHLQSLLDRRPAETFEFDEKALQTQVVHGYSDDDPRWCVALLRFTAPPDLDIPPDGLQTGLRDLESAHLLSRNSRAWQPTDEMLKIAAGWRTALPGIAHELIGVDPDRDKIEIYRHTIAMRGEGPLRVIDYQGLPDGAPTCFLRSLDAEKYREHLQSLLQIPPPLPAKVTPKSAPSAAAQVECPSCGQMHDARARFCPWCGASRSQPKPKPDATAKRQKPAPPTPPPVRRKQYSRDIVEALAQLLQAARDIDRIDDVRFKKLHASFRGEDTRGQSWTVGLKSLKWYRLDGKQWKPAAAPARLAMDPTLVSEIEGLHPAPAQATPPRPNLRTSTEIALAKTQRPAALPKTTPAPASPPKARGERKCPNCGRPVERPQAKFCPNCGRPLLG